MSVDIPTLIVTPFVRLENINEVRKGCIDEYQNESGLPDEVAGLGMHALLPPELAFAYMSAPLSQKLLRDLMHHEIRVGHEYRYTGEDCHHLQGQKKTTHASAMSLQRKASKCDHPFHAKNQIQI